MLEVLCFTTLTCTTTMYDLTVVPPEIWQDIFTLTCTDGGRTGLNIALTCRFLHAQSSRARFHSVRLSSLTSLEGFLTCTRGHRPPVRHLSLRLLPSHARRLHTAWLCRSSGAWDRAIDEREAERISAALHTRLTTAANELFAMVAPTLRTLCLTTGYTHTLAPFPCDMPLLEELTIMGSITTITGPNPPRLPALKRFHFLPQSAVSDMEELAAALTASALCTAPLTHLRLSQVYDHQRPDLSSILTRALGIPLGQHVPGGPEAHEAPTVRHKGHGTLPSVREVIVQTIIPDLGWCGNAYFDYRRETLAFEGFVQACNNVRDLCVVAVARKQRNFRWRERLYEDWVERIEGGRGCWIGNAEDEAALERRVERQGDVYNSIEDAVRNWEEDYFNGEGDDEFEEMVAELNEAGICGGVVDGFGCSPSQPTSTADSSREASVPRGASASGDKGGGWGRGRKCMIM